MMPVHHFTDHRSELLEKQPKKFFALAFVPAQPLDVVMEDGAGSATFEAAAYSTRTFRAMDAL